MGPPLGNFVDWIMGTYYDNDIIVLSMGDTCMGGRNLDSIGEKAKNRAPRDTNTWESIEIL